MSRARGGLPNVSFNDPMVMADETEPNQASAELLQFHGNAIKDDNEAVVMAAFGELKGIAITPAGVDLAISHRRKIIGAHKATLQNMIEIGTLLIDLQGQLPFMAFTRFLEADIIPFEKSYASKLMTVAEKIPMFQSVYGEGYQVDRLPAFNVCYELSTLKDDQLVAAHEKGLLAPTTTIKLIGEFKSALRSAGSPLSLHRELKKRRVELNKTLGKADELRFQIGQLEQKIAAL